MVLPFLGGWTCAEQVRERRPCAMLHSPSASGFASRPQPRASALTSLSDHLTYMMKKLLPPRVAFGRDVPHSCGEGSWTAGLSAVPVMLFCLPLGELLDSEFIVSIKSRNLLKLVLGNCSHYFLDKVSVPPSTDAVLGGRGIAITTVLQCDLILQFLTPYSYPSPFFSGLCE